MRPTPVELVRVLKFGTLNPRFVFVVFTKLLKPEPKLEFTPDGAVPNPGKPLPKPELNPPKKLLFVNVGLKTSMNEGRVGLA